MRPRIPISRSFLPIGLLTLLAYAAVTGFISAPIQETPTPIKERPAHPQETPAPEEELRWTPGRRLSWADFKGRPDPANRMDALTQSGISFTWSCDDRGFRSEAYAMFLPQKSWVRDPSTNLLA